MKSSKNNEDIGRLYGIVIQLKKIKLQIKMNQVLQESPKIIVNSPEKVEPGFFYKSYITHI